MMWRNDVHCCTTGKLTGLEPMARHTLYAYIEGYDNDAIAEPLEAQLNEAVNGATWAYGKPWVVNQRRDDPTLRPGDLPPWEIGLNFDLPDPGQEPLGWFSDVEAIVLLMRRLRSEFGRDFVLGIGDNQTGFSEDLFFINSDEPDLRQLRAMIGVVDGAH